MKTEVSILNFYVMKPPTIRCLQSVSTTIGNQAQDAELFSRQRKCNHRTHLTGRALWNQNTVKLTDVNNYYLDGIFSVL